MTYNLSRRVVLGVYAVLVIVPLVATIVALALYPGFVVERSEATVDGGSGAVAAAAERADEPKLAEAVVR